MCRPGWTAPSGPQGAGAPAVVWTPQSREGHAASIPPPGRQKRNRAFTALVATAGAEPVS
eukprot:2768709-Prymnesium_polylepis.2